MDIDHLKYPIGRFVPSGSISSEQLDEAIDYISNYPELFESACGALNETYLAKKYRPGGWTIRQLIHHVADSHMNALIRFKLALTEENPVIKPYLEQNWAFLDDVELPVSVAVDLIRNIHTKWAILLQNMKPKDFERSYFHPESKSLVSLKEACLIYQWHGKHHLAHIHLPSMSISEF